MCFRNHKEKALSDAKRIISAKSVAEKSYIVPTQIVQLAYSLDVILPVYFTQSFNVHSKSSVAKVISDSQIVLKDEKLRIKVTALNLNSHILCTIFEFLWSTESDR